MVKGSSFSFLKLLTKYVLGGILPSNPLSRGGKGVTGQDTDPAVTKVPFPIMYGVAGTGVGTSLWSVFLVGAGGVTNWAGYLTTAIASYAVYQKHRLAHLGGFRRLCNELRAHVNTLGRENNKLTSSVDQMEVAVTELEEVEGSLQKFANTTNVNRLVEVVQENKRLQRQIKENLEAQVMQTVMTTLFRSDRNKDLSLSRNELLIFQVRMQNMEGVDFNDETFMKYIDAVDNDDDDDPTTITNNNDVPLAKIMQLLRNLLDDDLSPEENIFVLHPEELIEE
mmetsp:Transcript_3651/g.6656  ORF Transcript_3651/g.6656 Transcript_3651/m.6656 type:complete len:281 (-) Transcript_3651:159-1001(-)|eukprot:CAMPEP_0198298522 /NCGR_PEP_ID=MMETSP1449-20131203/41087_1 /TAXON_ID=420275 /ORGANISM="Attheya septentrionalis, Strain CCMP2084" /LENGTH=280 /DNA_ID=CAMNT_0043999807 /DNA_START=78 /DNA_END=920 /DNA_ORIENTATION=+